MIALRTFSLLLFPLLFLVSQSYANEEDGKFPHFSKGACNICHLTHNGKGLLKDPITLCKDCHPTSHDKDHKVGIVPKLNKAKLPLDEEGRMVCAYTCHNMHPPKGSILEKGLLRTDPDTLCLSCHEK